MTQKGAKLILDFKGSNDWYSEDETEEKLLNFFKTSNNETGVSELLKDKSNWAMQYHLSPIRRNLLSWYDFTPQSTLLEIGGGCGAFTGMFCEKVSQVTSVELTERRAKIIFNRHKNFDNLTVFAGDVRNVNLTQKFDYVTSIGVMEYVGKNNKIKDPYLDFLTLLRGLLKKDGVFVLAIENKLGLKYWSGCTEDHSGILFDSIEDYSVDDSFRTFSKKELDALLLQAGFQEFFYYYPFPDYKMPLEIFSQDYLPNGNHEVRQSLFPFKDYSAKRNSLFDEKKVLGSLSKAGLFEHFSNSFLIFAK